MDSVILEEDIDENYEPTQAEIDEYAAWLGMNRPEDDDLLWVASEGLKAPLPENWKPCKTQDGEIYYFNFASGESVWDHPCDDYYRKTYEEEKAKKLWRQTEEKQKRAGVSSSAKSSASGGTVTLGRQPPGGPVGMAALSAAKLVPIGGAALAPICVSSGSIGAIVSAKAPEEKPKTSSAKSPSKSSPNKSKKTRSSDSSKSSTASAEAGAASASSPTAYGRRLSEHDIEVISQEAAESRAKLVELAARVEGELEQERDAALEDTRLQMAADGKADDEMIRSAQREATLGSIVEAGEQLKAQVLAHAEATLAAERVAVAARRRAIMEKDLASEIAELSAARAEVVQGAAAVAAAKRVQELQGEAKAALAAREAAAAAKELAASTALDAARAEAAVLVEAAKERAAKAAAERLSKDAEAAAALVRSAAMAEAAKAGEEAAAEAARVRAEAEAEAGSILAKATEKEAALRAGAQAAAKDVAEAASERDQAVAVAARAKREAEEELQKAREEAKRLRSEAAAEAARLRDSAEEEIARRAAIATQAASGAPSDEASELRAEVERLREELAASIMASEAAAADSALAARAAAEQAVASARDGAEAVTRALRAEAEEEAAATRRAAEEEANRLLQEAQSQAEALRAEAEAERARRVAETVEAGQNRALASSEAASMIAAAKLEAERIRTSAEAQADELRRASAAASARATAAAQTALTMSSRAEVGGAAADGGAEGIPSGIVIKSLADLAGEPLVVSSSAANAAERPAASAAPAAKRYAWGVDEKENAGAHGGTAEEADTEIAAMLRAQRRQVLSERSRLQQARSLLNEQSRNIRKRQEHIVATQREWKADMRRINELCDVEQRDALGALMRQVRLSLERQTAQLNEETEHVQLHSARVREWEASLQQLDASYKEMLAASEPSEGGFRMQHKIGHRERSVWLGGTERGGTGVAYDELRVELARIAHELSALVSAPGVPYVPHPPSSFFARHPYEKRLHFDAESGLDRNAKFSQVVPAVAVTSTGTAWVAQRERVQSLMQSHARWLRKLRDQVAFAR